MNRMLKLIARFFLNKDKNVNPFISELNKQFVKVQYPDGSESPIMPFHLAIELRKKFGGKIINTYCNCFLEKI